MARKRPELRFNSWRIVNSRRVDFRLYQRPGDAMAIIEDVSTTLSNMSFDSSFNFATGRMLSLASSDSGKLIFAGSVSSGVWVSEDGGDNWAQVEWPQPDAGQFGVPGAMGGSCVPSLAVAP